MTYKEKAINILIEKLFVNKYEAEDIVTHLDKHMEFKPCVLGILNAPKELEDWSAEIV
jgi:hypothetical protein